MAWWNRRRFNAQFVVEPQEPPPPPDPVLAPKLCGLCRCEPVADESNAIVVREYDVTVSSRVLCKNCTQSYMEEYSGTCAVCDRPILPGQPFCFSGREEPGREFTCLGWECGSGAGFALVPWGEGGPADTHPFNLPEAVGC